MIAKYLPLSAAALVVSVGVAHANPILVLAPDSTPMQVESIIELDPAAAFATPFGKNATRLTISNFSYYQTSKVSGTTPADWNYFYKADFTTYFDDGSKFTLTGGEFDIVVAGRGTAAAIGTFTTQVTTATFTGTYQGHSVTTSLSSIPNGSATFSKVNGDVYVAEDWPNSIPGQFSVDGGPNTSVPLTATTTSLTALPEPATMAQLGLPMLGMLAARRRRA